MELIQTLKATISGDDDRGVSPVIGVILMVAITVILAAVIATFVLGLGEQVSGTAPQVTVDWNESTPGGGGSGLADITVGATHNGGATVEAGNIELTNDGSGSSETSRLGYSDGSEIQSGQLLGLVDGLSEGDTVRLVWESDEGSTTATLSDYTVTG